MNIKTSSDTMVFSNELILENIFNFLPVKDLKNIRLVCSLWRNVCCPVFQEKSFVKLRENGQREGSVMARFVTTFATTPTSRVLFRNYQLFSLNLDLNCDATETFWEKFGPSMESIDLRWVRLVGVDIVRDILFNFTPNLRRLFIKDCNFYENIERGQRGLAHLSIHEKLADVDDDVKVNWNLTSIYFGGGEKHTTLPICWEEIFGAFPNLKDLSFYNLTVADTVGILEIAKSCQEKNSRSLQLHKLNIFNGDYAATEIPVEIMDLLTSLKLPLKELSIDLGVTFNYNRTAQLLQQQQNLLKMIIYRGPRGTPMKKFPFGIIFPNLHYLEITETVSDCMGFVQFMPNLNTLALCEPPEVEPPFFPVYIITKTDINFTQMPLKTKLSTIKIEYDVSCADVRKLVFWFPSINRAKLYLDNEGFRTVCGEWSKLTELEVLGERLDCEGVTGIVENTVGTTTIKTCNPLNITNLKYLSKFIMVNYNSRGILIEDLCVDEGFLKLPRLKYLELCARHISEQGWTKLFNCKQIETLLSWDGTRNSSGKSCYTFKRI